MKKIFALLCALLLVLFVCMSCKDSTSSGDETITENGSLSAEAVAEYVIVRGDMSSEAVTSAAVSIRSKIEELTGVKIELTTDWTKKGEAIKRYSHEIIIGDTNRAESEVLYAEFDAAENPMDYIIRKSENHFVIALSDEAAAETAEIFVNSFLIKSDDTSYKIADTLNLSREHNFPLRTLTLGSSGIGEYSIVYPSYYDEYQKADINEICGIIYRATGYEINAVSDSAYKKEADKKYIFIGTAGGDTVSSLKDLTYRTVVNQDGVYLGGSNFWADIKALNRWFLQTFMGYNPNGSFECTFDTYDNLDITVTKKEYPISIEAWCTSGDPVNTENQIKEVAEAGFTCANLAVPGDKRELHNLLKWCAVYDLDILWHDSSVYGTFAESDIDKMAAYIDAPQTLGFYLRDEPNAVDFESLAASSRAFEAVSNKQAFINLFPMYASNEQLGSPSYYDHIRDFLDTVKPTLCSVDIYPCNSYGLYDGYMENLDIVAAAARERGIPLAVYIQSVSFAESKRTPSLWDIEWQSYCCLSFGAVGIKYFTYITPYSAAEDFKPALIDHELKKTDRWYHAQTVNAELKYLSSALGEYKNVGAFSHNCTSDTKFLQFDNQYDFSSVIKKVECDNPLLFGCFENDEGYAFTVVNMTNLQMSKGISEVKIKTDAPVTVYQNSETKLLEPVSGYISLTLDVGEGVFCVVENQK